jgi:hypothetical protein
VGVDEERLKDEPGGSGRWKRPIWWTGPMITARSGGATQVRAGYVCCLFPFTRRKGPFGPFSSFDSVPCCFHWLHFAYNETLDMLACMFHDSEQAEPLLPSRRESLQAQPVQFLVPPDPIFRPAHLRQSTASEWPPLAHRRT